MITKEIHNEFYHEAMSYILGELINVKKNNGVPMVANVNGNFSKRTCYFEVAFYIGYASWNHKLCFHYVNFSGNISRKQRKCDLYHVKSDKINLFFQINVGDKN